MVIRSPFFEAKLQLGVAVFVRASLCLPRSSGRWYWGVSACPMKCPFLFYFIGVAISGFEKNEGLSLKPSPLLPHNQPGP